MLLQVEVPEKNLQDFANTFSLVNDATLKDQGDQMLSKYVEDQMRIKIAQEEQQTLEAAVDTRLAKGEVKPGTATVTAK